MADNETTPTGLKDLPTLFDETEVPFFYGSEAYNKVQETSQSESGKDLIQVTRASKLSLSCSFAIVDKDWVAFFKEYSLKPSFTLSLYDPYTNDYALYTVRMEGYTQSRRRKSQELDGIFGIWDISFTIEEF